MSYITIDDVLNVKVPAGWEPCEDPRLRTLCWSNSEADAVIYATPGWDGENVVLFDIFDRDGIYSNFYILMVSGTIEEQVSAYESKLNEAIEFINNL